VNRVAELLAAVHADPDDLAVRLVYADALSELDDPRGEFIALQCRGGADDARERELLDAHRDAWLGKLAAILDPAKTEFANGFLSIAAVKKVQRPKLLAAAGNPMWSTVTRIDFDADIGGIAMKWGALVRGARVPAAAILLSPVTRALREVTGIDGDVLLTLCREGNALPIRSISASTYPLLEQDAHGVWRVADAERIDLEHARGLSQLRRLELHGYPCDRPDLVWLLRSPLAARLEYLRLGNFGGKLDHWIEMARQAGPELPELVIDYWGVARFRRGRSGLLDVLDVDARNLTAHQRGLIDDALARVPPGTLQHVDVKR
jgi:uncharacterized protein (TIGR02996 family)